MTTIRARLRLLCRIWWHDMRRGVRRWRRRHSLLGKTVEQIRLKSAAAETRINPGTSIVLTTGTVRDTAKYLATAAELERQRNDEWSSLYGIPYPNLPRLEDGELWRIRYQIDDMRCAEIAQVMEESFGMLTSIIAIMADSDTMPADTRRLARAWTTEIVDPFRNARQLFASEEQYTDPRVAFLTLCGRYKSAKAYIDKGVILIAEARRVSIDALLLAPDFTRWPFLKRFEAEFENRVLAKLGETPLADPVRVAPVMLTALTPDTPWRSVGFSLDYQEIDFATHALDQLDRMGNLAKHIAKT